MFLNRKYWFSKAFNQDHEYTMKNKKKNSTKKKIFQRKNNLDQIIFMILQSILYPKLN